MNPPHVIAVRRGSRSGFTLVECLVYIAVLFLVTCLAFSVFFSLLTHHRNIVRCTEDIARAMNAGERWRADVRAAVAPPVLETSPLEQSLRLPQTNGSIVYLFSGGEVWRIVNDKTPDKPLLDKVRVSRMDADPRARVTAWRWDLELVVIRKKAKIIPLFAFLAAEPHFPTHHTGAIPSADKAPAGDLPGGSAPLEP